MRKTVWKIVLACCCGIVAIPIISIVIYVLCCYLFAVIFKLSVIDRDKENVIEKITYDVVQELNDDYMFKFDDDFVLLKGKTYEDTFGDSYFLLIEAEYKKILKAMDSDLWMKKELAGDVLVYRSEEYLVEKEYYYLMYNDDDEKRQYSMRIYKKRDIDEYIIITESSINLK